MGVQAHTSHGIGCAGRAVGGGDKHGARGRCDRVPLPPIRENRARSMHPYQASIAPARLRLGCWRRGVRGSFRRGVATRAATPREAGPALLDEFGFGQRLVMSNEGTDALYPVGPAFEQADTGMVGGMRRPGVAGGDPWYDVEAAASGRSVIPEQRANRSARGQGESGASAKERGSAARPRRASRRRKGHGDSAAAG